MMTPTAATAPTLPTDAPVAGITAVSRADANIYASVKAHGAGVAVPVDCAAAHCGMTLDDALDAAERLVLRKLLRVHRPVAAGGVVLDVHVVLRG